MQQEQQQPNSRAESILREFISKDLGTPHMHNKHTIMPYERPHKLRWGIATCGITAGCKASIYRLDSGWLEQQAGRRSARQRTLSGPKSSRVTRAGSPCRHRHPMPQCKRCGHRSARCHQHPNFLRDNLHARDSSQPARLQYGP